MIDTSSFPRVSELEALVIEFVAHCNALCAYVDAMPERA